MERFIDKLWEIWYKVRPVSGYRYMNHVSDAWEGGYVAASRNLEIDMLHPSLYDDGFNDGYAQALTDYLNDECTDAIIMEAREWQAKKERNANS